MKIPPVILLFFSFTFAQGPAKDLDFAKWLYNQGQYYAAFNAYERSIFFSSFPEEKKNAAKGALNSLLRGGRSGEVFQVLPVFQALDVSDSEFQEALKLFEARARIQKKEYSNAYALANSVLRSPARSTLSNSARREAFLVMSLALVDTSPLNQIRSSLSRIRLDDFEPVESDFRRAWKNNLASVSDKPKLPLTSPLLSGIFGAVLPGLGHLYNERPLDALQNFLINSVLISLSVFLLRDDLLSPGKEGRFLLSAPVTAAAGAFYLVNLYSSVNVCLRRNEKLEAGFRLGIQKNLEAMAFRFQIEW